MSIKQLLKSEKTVYLLLAVLSLAALTPYIIACFYIHPNMDDWTFAAELESRGRAGFISYYYATWSGRFFAFILLSIAKAHVIMSPIWYKIIPIIFIVLTNLIIYKMIGFFLLEKMKKTRVLILSVFATAFYITGLQELFSAVFWNCSSYYLLGNVIFLWLVYEILTFMIQGKQISSIKFLKIVIICSLICGLTEIYIISLGVVFSFVVLYHFIVSKKIRYDFLILIAVTIICGGLNIFSPGTFARMGVSEVENGLVYSAVRAFYDFIILQIAPLFYNGFLLVLLLIFLTAKQFFIGNEKLNKFFKIHPLISLLLVFFVFFLHHAASVYGAGYTLQGRVLNFTNLLFYFSLIFIVLNTVAYFNLEEVKIKPRISLLYIAVIAVFTFNFSPNSRVVTKELLYDLPTFDKEMKERYVVINKAISEGADHAIINRVSVNPRVLTLGAYQENRNYYNSELLCMEMTTFFKIEVSIFDADYDVLED